MPSHPVEPLVEPRPSSKKCVLPILRPLSMSEGHGELESDHPGSIGVLLPPSTNSAIINHEAGAFKQPKDLYLLRLLAAMSWPRNCFQGNRRVTNNQRCWVMWDLGYAGRSQIGRVLYRQLCDVTLLLPADDPIQGRERHRLRLQTGSTSWPGSTLTQSGSSSYMSMDSPSLEKLKPPW